MAIFYKSGRSRTVRLVLDINIGGTVRALGSDTGQTLGAGSSYTTLLDAEFSSGIWKGASRGFHCRMCLGIKGTTIGGDRNAALGVRTPSLTGNGFTPLVLLVGSSSATTASTTISITLERTLALDELYSHTNNGARKDVYSAPGSCTQTYTVHAPGGDVVYTSGTGYISGGISLGQFPPGQEPPWGMFGIDSAAFTEGFSCFSLSTLGGGGGVAASGSWSGGLVDSSGDALYPDPSVPPYSGTGGSASWGAVATRAPSTVGVVYNLSSVYFQWMPTHAFRVRTEPRALPDGRPLVQQHRIEYELVSPIGGSGSTSGMTLYSSGETISFVCGGIKWQADLTGEGSYSHVYDAFLPVLSRVKVTASDASRHFFAHVRAPYDGIALSQAQALTIPGTAGLSVPTSTPQIVSVGKWLGYRWLRVRGYSTSGAGSLAIGIKLDGSSSYVATGTLTTSAADTPGFVDIDLVASVGAITDEALTLDSITFTASSHDFVINDVQAFIKKEAVVVSCSRRRAEYSTSDIGDLPGPEATPWISCYTDGVLSLRAPSFQVGTPVAWWSDSIAQLVAEINGTSLPSYSGGWSPAEPLTFVQASGAPPAPSTLTGWTATLSTPPAGGKSYSADEVYDATDWTDGDTYVSALHGDGLIEGAPLLAGVAEGGY